MMNKNEERIWDTLIEDALKQRPVPAGEYTRRLLTPVGAPAIDRGRSLRRPRRKWAPVAVTTLALILVALALYAATTWLPQLTQPEPTDQPKAAETQNQSPLRKRRDGPPTPTPSPEPQPEPQDSGATDAREPTPDKSTPPKPEPKPDDTIDQPKPEPEPDDTIEQPKPESKPDDTVEQPREPKPEEPKKPEGTSPTPGAELSISLLKEGWGVPGAMRYSYSYDGKEWFKDRLRMDFGASIWLDADTILTIEAEGVLIRLDGKARFTLTEGALAAELIDCDAYIDNRGCTRPVTATVEEFTLTLASGEVLVGADTSKSTISLYDGELRFGDESLAAGQHGILRKSGFYPDKRPQKPREEESLLAALPARVKYRETFDNNPEGRLREGEIKDGALTGPTVFWGYPDNLQHEAGLVLRLRVRFTGATVATVTQFAVPRDDNFSLDVAGKTITNGEWQTIELRVDDFLERTTHKEHPSAADWFQNVSIQLQGENAQVELDWVELIRAVR